MTKRFYRKRSVLDKLTALLVVTAMFLTSSPVIALDTLRAAEQLSEQTFTLTPQERTFCMPMTSPFTAVTARSLSRTAAVRSLSASKAPTLRAPLQTKKPR